MENSLLLFLLWPFVTGLLLFLFPKKIPLLAQYSSLVFQIVWVLLFVWAIGPIWEELSVAGDGGGPRAFPVYFSWDWIPFLKSRFSLGLDGLNIPLLGLNVLLSLCLGFFSLNKKNLGPGYLGLFSILNGASVGSLLAADAFVFYCFWEFMLIPMYLLIGGWGSKNRVYASLKFFAFTMAGSLFMLAAILALAFQFDVASLGWHDLVATNFEFQGWGSVQGLLFLGFMLAFVVKIPVWPFHTWLPDAHTEAPTGASVILAGVLLKLGVYGIARWCLPLFPEASAAAAPTLMALGCVGIVMGAFAAWFQTDIKKMIAYSSVSHLGFMVLGLFALGVEALQGAFFQNIAHGLSTGALFLIFGIIYERTHSREISKYGGFAQEHAWLATSFILASMASIGLPGLPGFVGEFLILAGSFKTFPVYSLVALSGVLLGAIYMLGMLRRFAYGPVSELVKSHPVRVTWNEWASLVPLLLFMIYLGFGSQAILSKVEPAATQVLTYFR